MSHDRSSDTFDAGLSALYKAHLGAEGDAAAQPSPAADARIRELALGAGAAAPAAARPAGRPVDTGWRSWMAAAWFKPSLAFATLACLSVVIVALMPREDINVERAEPAPASPAPAQQPEKDQGATTEKKMEVSRAEPGSPAKLKDQSQPAPADVVPESRVAARADATPRADVTSRADVAPRTDVAPRPDVTSRVKVAPRDDAAPRADAAARADVPQRAKAARAPEAPSARTSLESRPRQQIAEPPPAAAPAPPPSAAMAPAQPNPFPGSSPAVVERRSDKTLETSRAAAVPASPPPAPAVAPAPAAALARQSPALGAAADSAGAQQRIEKPSNLPEASESRANSQPLPEVRDSAPTYPNEPRLSIPLPNTYVGPRPHLRDSQPSGATGSVSGSGRQSAAMSARKEEALQKRSFDGPPSMASTAAPPRDPAAWIKIILKLRADGKTEQVVKELVEFRKQFPAYALPEELKPLAPK